MSEQRQVNGQPEAAGTERQLAEAMWENSRWLDANMNRLLQEHPDYEGKYAIIASRCAEPVLAVDDDCERAYEAALKSEELQRIAATANLPPGLLITTISFTDW